MSVGKNLQEMENVVTKGASPAEPMPKLSHSTPGQTGTWEDLGGPTPENYRTDDNSAKLKEPSVKTVADVVNSKAAKVTKEETDVEEEIIEEDSVEDTEILEENDEDLVEVAEDSEVVEYSIEEDINALLEGEELSEEFQEKARTIFEAAINSKVDEIKESLEERYENALVEEIALIKENLQERVDAYLEYVADEWIKENSLSVENGLKTEMTESFLSGMKQLFEEHYVTIPEDRYDVIEGMVDKLDEMEAKLNEQIERNVALNQRLAESVADVIFAEVSEGLALSQKDKLASLAENVEFDSEESYREKLVTLRESYFPMKSSAQGTVSENLTESADIYESTEQVSPVMAAYLNALGKVSKK
jgi:hypothetical protein